MAKQKKKAPAKPRKAVEQKRTTIEQRMAAENLTAHKAAKLTAQQARDRLAAERAALPANFPILPFADTLVGREFYARVNCELTPNRKGKLVNRCDTQRVTVVGGASPSAAKPKTKQVFAVQKGQRYIVPDRELRRAVRVPKAPPQTACETYGDQLRAGRPVPAEAYDECPSLPDVGGVPYDTSFEPFEFESPKPNHHGGYHAPGDPLGGYMPPLAQWRTVSSGLAQGVGNVRVWRHPALGLQFAVGEVRGRGYVAQVWNPSDGYDGRPARDTVLSYYDTPDAAHRALALYAAQQAPRKPNRGSQGVPGGSYYSDRADAWIGQTVGGDDYAGEIRARAVARDGAPAHVVGGHVMTRSRALAGARREDIRTGALPPPRRPGRSPKVVATVRGEEPPHASRPLAPRAPRPVTMPPPPRTPRFGVPALEEARPRPLGASAITFEWSESERLNELGLPRTFSGPAMWQEATALLREGIAAKARGRREGIVGEKGYCKTGIKVEYPDGFYYEGRYDIGDPIPTDLAQFVRLASKYAAKGDYHVPERSGPDMPTPFTNSGGGVKSSGGGGGRASRNLGHWAVVKAGDQVVLRSGHRMESTLRGTVAEVVRDQAGEPGVVLLDPQRLLEGNGTWAPRYEGQRPGDTLRVMRGQHTLEIAPHQPGNIYRDVPARRPWSAPPALEERRPLPPRAARFGAPALEEPRPRRAPVARPPAAPAPRRASDEELMRAMMEELAAAGIVVKQNRRPPPRRRY